MGLEGVCSGVPGLPGGQEQAVPTQTQGPYDGRAHRARPVGLPRSPPQICGAGAPQGVPLGHAFTAAL